MFSLFVGMAAGFTLLLNGQKVRLGIVRAVLTGSEMAKEAGKETRRLTTRMMEDIEDDVAEVKAEKAKAGADQQSMSDLVGQLRELRSEIAAMEPKGHTVQ